MSTIIQVVDDRSLDIIYTENWYLLGIWTAKDGQSGTLSSTNDQAAGMTFVSVQLAWVLLNYLNSPLDLAELAVCRHSLVSVLLNPVDVPLPYSQ